MPIIRGALEGLIVYQSLSHPGCVLPYSSAMELANC